MMDVSTKKHNIKQRSSNIELLRIVAMSMVLLSHFLWFGITNKSIPEKTFNFFVPIVACGVNLFFMISGWFTIRCSFKSIMKLILTILMFVLINRLISIPFTNINVFNQIGKVFAFPISSSSYWFIKVYLFLIITAPILNIGLENMPLKTLRKFVIIFLLFNVYSCAIGSNLCNERGFSYMQGFLMYTLGYYLKKDYNLYIRISVKMAFLLFGIIMIVCTIGTSELNLWAIFTLYNSIFLILASFVLFIGFTKIKIQNNAINYMASASLGCYLLQDGYFGWHYMYDYMHQVFISDNYILIKISIYFFIFLGTWIVSLIISPIIKYIVNCIINLLQSVFPNRFIKLFDLGS